MEDNINNEIVEEVIESPVVSDNETNEPETKVEAEKKPEVEKPWKQKKPDAIPYDRFKEVNDRAKEYEAKVREYEAKVRAYEEAQAKANSAPVIKEIDDIKIEDYDTAQDWLKAREKFLQEKTIEQFEQRQLAKQQEAQARQREEALANTFNERLAKSVAIDPEIGEAVEWFANTYASRLPVQIRYAIVSDENAPELIKHMAEDNTIMQTIMDGNHLDAIRMMSKWSAKFTREEAKEPSNEVVEEKKPLVVPKTIKASTTSSKDPNKMSKEEYRAWRASRK